MNNRKIQAAKTKARLIEVGKELFARCGYDQTTVDDMCEASGIAKGTFYHHFKAKNDVIMAIEVARHDDITKVVLDSQGRAFETRLNMLIASWVATTVDLGLLLVRQLLKYDLGPGYQEGHTDYPFGFLTRLLKVIFTDAIASGELPHDFPQEQYANAIASQCYGITYCWCSEDGGFDVAERVTESVGMIAKVLPHA